MSLGGQYLNVPRDSETGEGRKVKLQIFDLPGDGDNKEHYKDACVAVVVADYSDKSTLNKC